MGLTGWAIAASAFGIRPDSGLPRAGEEEPLPGSPGTLGPEAEVNLTRAVEAHQESLRFTTDRPHQRPD